MAVVSAAVLSILEPWFDSSGSNEKNEQGMYCPLHDDRKRSSSLNLTTGQWYCHGCQEARSAVQLAKEIQSGDLEPPLTNGHGPKSKTKKESDEKQGPLSEGIVSGCHSALFASKDILRDFTKRRGLDRDTIKEFRIGWDKSTKAYSIPVYDIEGKLVNIRWYQLDPQDDRRKIWSILGRGAAVLFPAPHIPDLGEEVVLCEGELDALLTIQNGFSAITRTAGATTWKSEWNKVFTGKTVYLIHDMDHTGQSANRKIRNQLIGVAAKVVIVALPYPLDPKHGKDLTDYWLDGHEYEEFRKLLDDASAQSSEDAGSPLNAEAVDASLLDSFDASNSGKVLRMRATITGKKWPTYDVPRQASLTCDMEAGPKCGTCPMGPDKAGGQGTVEVEPADPAILAMINSPSGIVNEMIRQAFGALKCTRLQIETITTQSVEELYVRPSVDAANIQDDEVKAEHYLNRRLFSVGRHDSQASQTVEVTGQQHPNPRTQQNEFQAWDVLPTRSSVDSFEISAHNLSLLRRFQPTEKQGPMVKLGLIAEQLSKHVTKIYGRPEMHALMDLVFHSALAFHFDGKLESRGWLDAIIVGDTRTGKSESAKMLIQHYGAGEFVSCESATFAGVVGGLQQIGKEWIVTWGAIPLNDRRLVVLDEISGLEIEQISQMSSIRSSGEAELTKIRSERTRARTRLLWMGNPRHATMREFTFGVQAIPQLIGNNEDVARFDIGMAVSDGEVPESQINQHREVTGQLLYTSEACQVRLLWAWSRTASQIEWEKGAESLVFEKASWMGQNYYSVPPLVQAANVRIKIARVAVALALTTASCSEDGERCIVTKRHVEDATAFMDRLYSMKGFGYREMSNVNLLETKVTDIAREKAFTYLDQRRQTGLVRFLGIRSNGFRRDDMETMLNWSKEESVAAINQLWINRVVTSKSGEIQLSQLGHELIREMGME